LLQAERRKNQPWICREKKPKGKRGEIRKKGRGRAFPKLDPLKWVHNPRKGVREDLGR